MECFKKNSCRFCKKIFCCTKCREQHETSVHKIFIECNICLYGKTFLRCPADDLLKHYEDKHLPLHCKFCRQHFATIEDISQQNKCPVGYKQHDLEKSSKIPVQPAEEQNYESPPPYFIKGHLTAPNNMFSYLATSTPLQREENHLPEKSNQEVITPVDCSDINKKSFECESLKRKVTFCETPMTDSYRKPKNMLNAGNKFENWHITTPNSDDKSSSIFLSAKQNLQEISEESDENQPPKKSPEDLDEKNKEQAETENTTLWISAINTPPTQSTEEKKPFDMHFTTPVIAKFKRQVNVVMPITIKNNCNKLELPSNLHSTALSLSTADENEPTSSSKISVLVNDSNKISNISSISSETNKVLSGTSTNILGGFLNSVNKLVQNVTNAVQGFSNATYSSKTSMKRSSLECDFYDGPPIKRYKLTDIKCRPPIRNCIEYSSDLKVQKAVSNRPHIIKTFADKATQTGE